MRLCPAASPGRDCTARDGGLARVPPQRPDPPATAPPAAEPLAGTVADAFPPAEARPARTPEEMRRLARGVAISSFAASRGLVAAGVYGLFIWVAAATVPAPAMLQVEQGIVLFQDRGAGPLLNARNGMALQEGDALEIKDNSLARLNLPGRGSLRLGPNAHLVLADLRTGRFNAAAGRMSMQHTAGTVRAEVEAASPGPLALETPYGT